MLPNDTQAQMYNALTPLFNHVTNADLNQDFKSEKFGTAGQCPCSTEPVPYQGVTIIRDKYDVPHVSATTPRRRRLGVRLDRRRGSRAAALAGSL